jgi:hypothetical protein
MSIYDTLFPEPFLIAAMENAHLTTILMLLSVAGFAFGHWYTNRPAASAYARQNPLADCPECGDPLVVGHRRCRRCGCRVYPGMSPFAIRVMFLLVPAMLAIWLAAFVAPPLAVALRGIGVVFAVYAGWESGQNLAWWRSLT